MQVLVRNTAKVPKKYVRLLKWKLYNLSEKFKDLLYSEAFIKKEGNTPIEYQLKLRLGLPGYDSIITKKSSDINKAILELETTAHVQLAELKKGASY